MANQTTNQTSSSFDKGFAGRGGAEGFVNHPHTAEGAVNSAKDLAKTFNSGALGAQLDSARTRVMDAFSRLPQIGRNVAGRVDQNARSNPWMHIGLVAAATFGLGYVLGRNTEFSIPDSIKGLAARVKGGAESEEEA